MIGNSKRSQISKKYIAVLCTLLVASAFIAISQPLHNVEASSTVNIFLDEKEIDVPQSLRFIEQGRVFVPIRFIAESIGTEVDWDAQEKKVSLFTDDRIVELWIGSDRYEVNGSQQKMDVEPFIQQSRTLVPIRFVAEGLDLNVRWDASTKSVLLNHLGKHTVMQGESLFLIGSALNTTADALIEMNDLTSNTIYPGQLLQVPAQKYTQKTVVIKERTEATSEDLNWLARIIASEARGEPFKGQVAVGAVVLNRVDDSHFPDTIYDVIFHKWEGYYQFEPVKNGEIHRVEPNATVYKAAKQALSGVDPTDGALYFHNPSISQSSWMAAKEVSLEIGNHVFMKR